MSIVIDDLICPECKNGNFKNCQIEKIIVDDITGLKVRVICTKYAQKLSLFHNNGDEMHGK